MARPKKLGPACRQHEKCKNSLWGLEPPPQKGCTYFNDCKEFLENYVAKDTKNSTRESLRPEPLTHEDANKRDLEDSYAIYSVFGFHKKGLLEEEVRDKWRLIYKKPAHPSFSLPQIFQCRECEQFFYEFEGRRLICKNHKGMKPVKTMRGYHEQNY